MPENKVLYSLFKDEISLIGRIDAQKLLELNNDIASPPNECYSYDIQ